MSSFEKLVLRFLYYYTIVHTYNALKLGGKCNKCNKIACVFIYERDVIKLYYPLWKISRNLVLFDLFHPPVSHPPLLADLYSRQLLILIAYWVSIARKFHRPHCEHVSSTFNTLQIVNSIMYGYCFYLQFKPWREMTWNYRELPDRTWDHIYALLPMGYLPLYLNG